MERCCQLCNSSVEASVIVYRIIDYRLERDESFNCVSPPQFVRFKSDDTLLIWLADFYDNLDD